MFFALIAGDKETFSRLLSWSNDNLSNGELGKVLPAWQWGKSDNGEWKILDKNAASDADLWMAYALMEAGRLWQQDDYLERGRNLSQQILQQEVIPLPGLGHTLLPGPYGFNPEPSLWRLNPSYAPVQLLRYFSENDKRWLAVLNSSIKLIHKSSHKGFTPDWVQFRLRKGVVRDSQTQGKGSYDAIRVYLWAGMLDVNEPHRTDLLTKLSPMMRHIEKHQLPPEQVDTDNGKTVNAGPIGFSAALLPFLAASNSSHGLISQLSRLLEQPLSQKSKDYYNMVLGLFGLGWHQEKYRFSDNGQLLLPRAVTCQ